jgi:hypothetical protein
MSLIYVMPTILHLPGGTEKNRKNLSQENRSQGRKLNSGPVEYKEEC